MLKPEQVAEIRGRAKTSKRKKTKFFWGAGRDGWKIYGIWWRQRVLVGISFVVSSEEWDDQATCRKCKEKFQYD